MRIGIMGSGIVGRVLASAFLKEGNDVMLGTRNVAKEEVIIWKNENSGGRTGNFEETAKFGELLVFATSGKAVEEAINLSGPANFAGKTVIDTTNPIADAPPVNGVLQFFTAMNSSLMERVQELLPGANVVKAFNSVGNNLMYKPGYNNTLPTMFICGNNAEAKKTVTEILTTFGWETEDMGHAEAARAVESLCILWCIPGFLNNRWTHAFKLLKK